MGKLKNRDATAAIKREEAFHKAIQALKDGTFTSIAEAAVAFELPKSTLGHRLKGRQNRQKAHEGDQILSPAAERAVVKWILKLSDHGFPARLDRLWEMIEVVAVKERELLRARYEAEGRRNIVWDHIGKNWITQFLNRHTDLASKLAVRMDRQRVYANDSKIIVDHFRKLGKIIKQEGIRPEAITNVDEKGIMLGISSKTKVLTRRGQKNPYVKQHGEREMITLVEAVTAHGYVYPTFLITKGKVHTYGSFGNVTPEDAKNEVYFAKSPKGWTDDELGYYWLTEVYEPKSRQFIQPGEKRLLILDGHVSHVNVKFCQFCVDHDIILFCLPAHSTHLLQPLDVGLFAPLQLAYSKVVEDYFLATGVGISHRQFLPLYKKARERAYTKANIESAFRKAGIVPLNPRAVLSTTATQRANDRPQSIPNSWPLDRTPYTKCQLRQQTNAALMFIKTATEGEVCNLIIKYSHIANYNMTKTEIAEVDMQRLRAQMKVAKAVTKDQRVLSRARVLTAAEGLEARKKLDEAVAAKVAKAAASGPRQRRKTQPAPSAELGAPVASVVKPKTSKMLRFALPPPVNTHTVTDPTSVEPRPAATPLPSVPATPKRTRVRRPGLPHSLPRARLFNPHQSDISSADASEESGSDWDSDSSNSNPFDILRTKVTGGSDTDMLTPAPATTVPPPWVHGSAPVPWVPGTMPAPAAKAKPAPAPKPAPKSKPAPAPIRPRQEPVLNTPQAPNRRLPDRPLGMSLRNRKGEN
jgi:hypothetical protein